MYVEYMYVCMYYVNMILEQQMDTLNVCMLRTYPRAAGMASSNWFLCGMYVGEEAAAQSDRRDFDLLNISLAK